MSPIFGGLIVVPIFLLFFFIFPGQRGSPLSPGKTGAPSRSGLHHPQTLRWPGVELEAGHSGHVPEPDTSLGALSGPGGGGTGEFRTEPTGVHAGGFSAGSWRVTPGRGRPPCPGEDSHSTLGPIGANTTEW